MLVVWASAFIVYQTTFISTPRLFVSPETGWFANAIDIPEYALALRGRPNETDMRKHLLYSPLGQVLYRAADRARLLCGMNYDTAALIFPQALYGATSVLAAYVLFLRLINRWRLAAIAACCYAFTYSMWLMSGVPESYALTTLAVNLFLLFILREKVARGWLWYPATIGLIALCSLCDLRYVSLMVIPLYLAACAPGLKLAQRIGLMCAIVVGTCCLIGSAYTLYQYASGREGFGIGAMCKWLPSYRQESTLGHHLLDCRSIAWSLRVFFIESISPLYKKFFDQSPIALQRIHLSLACCFWTMSATLILGSVRHIRAVNFSRRSLQALLCWLTVYLIELHAVFHRTALPHTLPIVLPLMLLIVPGVIKAWGPRQFGITIMVMAAVTMLANNLILINEARLAWQRPAIVQSPADHIYLLPGEIERAQFLTYKMSSLCPASERDRLTGLRTRAPHTLSAQERREFDELTFKGLERLTPSEREQLRDIMHRSQEAIRLARGGM